MNKIQLTIEKPRQLLQPLHLQLIPVPKQE